MRHEPATAFGISTREQSAVSRAIGHVAVIGNAMPRRCGLATYTSHSIDALKLARPELAVDHYAMDDGQPGLDYAPDLHLIPQHDIAAYRRAAAEINASDAELLWVQHEFGIFGGAAGEHLLTLLDAVRVPVVATLHTVLRHPNSDEDRVLRALIARAARLIVMAEHGRDILLDVYGVPVGRVEVIPHGVPERPYVSPEAGRDALGLPQVPTLMTFGLLAPSKGIETMIEAMPALVERHPGLRYHVLGATHPAVKRDCGEAYREGLVARAAELGVADALVLHDRFFADNELLDWLQAADVYVTPYGNPQQVTSGALSYAVAMGRAVVSTPYVHANEILADDHGVIVPFHDASAMGAAIDALLSDPAARAALAAKAWARGQTMRWVENGSRVLEIFDAEARRPVRLPRRGLATPASLPPVDLRAVERMTDEVGMLQHGIMRVPDRNHGYCIDDNARALMLVVQLPATERTVALASTYAAFVQHGWNADARRFRNFMGYDRQWLETTGSPDSNGRTLWALGVTARSGPTEPLRRWAQTMFEIALPMVAEFTSPRAVALAMLGADALLDARPGHGHAMDLLRNGAGYLRQRLHDARREGWDWFETVLSYDNARLPEALIRAGLRLDDAGAVEAGLTTLRWLDRQQTAPCGSFRAVGTESFGRELQRPRAYDQQPLEAWATVDAAHVAALAEPGAGWDAVADRAYGWFFGANEAGHPLASREDGGCFDGLNPEGLNLNQGAESILALQFATLAQRRAASALTDKPSQAPAALA